MSSARFYELERFWPELDILVSIAASMELKGTQMVYGELEDKALVWFTRFAFGLDPLSMPSKVVIIPSRVEECFHSFPTVMRREGLSFERVRSSFMVWRGDKQALFCEGGIGASIFADSSYILCHCKKVKEIIFIGTGAGIGEDVESADVNLPSCCIRLDKVLEILLPPEASAIADLHIVKKMRKLIVKEVQDLGIKVHQGIHATVPFFLAETKQLLTDLQQQGALSVDMELSVLYGLANRYQKKVAGIIRIGDLPLKGLPTWKSRSYKVELKEEVHTKILDAIIDYLFI
jgi:purine-nucleoside phosphorylase